MVMGRPKHSPNDLNGYTLGKNYRPPKPASDKRKTRGDKVHFSIDMPPYLFDQMRTEAMARGVSMQRLSIEWLEAAAGCFIED